MFLKGLLKLIEQLKSAIYPCFFAYRLLYLMSWKCSVAAVPEWETGAVIY